MITKEHGYTCNALAQRILQQSPLWRCYESVSTTIAGGGCTQYGNSGGPQRHHACNNSNSFLFPTCKYRIIKIFSSRVQVYNVNGSSHCFTMFNYCATVCRLKNNSCFQQIARFLARKTDINYLSAASWAHNKLTIARHFYFSSLKRGTSKKYAPETPKQVCVGDKKQPQANLMS